MVHLNGPYCELRTSQGTNYNSSFYLGQVFHIYLSVRSSFFAVFERSTSNCHTVIFEAVICVLKLTYVRMMRYLTSFVAVSFNICYYV